VLDHPPRDRYIINDKSTIKMIRKEGWLERFKRNVVFQADTERTYLVDVGSASGKFLDSMRNFFETGVCRKITLTLYDG
jgi:hypothetical protein